MPSYMHGCGKTAQRYILCPHRVRKSNEKPQLVTRVCDGGTPAKIASRIDIRPRIRA
jgi:hypothetical protein